jgi:hypothetical protein
MQIGEPRAAQLPWFGWFIFGIRAWEVVDNPCSRLCVLGCAVLSVPNRAGSQQSRGVVPVAPRDLFCNDVIAARRQQSVRTVVGDSLTHDDVIGWHLRHHAPRVSARHAPTHHLSFSAATTAPHARNVMTPISGVRPTSSSSRSVFFRLTAGKKPTLAVSIVRQKRLSKSFKRCASRFNKHKGRYSPCPFRISPLRCPATPFNSTQFLMRIHSAAPTLASPLLAEFGLDPFGSNFSSPMAVTAPSVPSVSVC